MLFSKIIIVLVYFLLSVCISAKEIETPEELIQKYNKIKHTIYDLAKKENKNINFEKNVEQFEDFNIPEHKLTYLVSNRILINEKSRMKATNYDIEQRMFLDNVFFDNEMIKDYNLLNYRSLAKHDNGLFTSVVIFLVFERKIKFYDINGILIGEKEFDFTIDDTLMYHTIDGKLNIC